MLNLLEKLKQILQNQFLDPTMDETSEPPRRRRASSLASLQEQTTFRIKLE